MSISSPGAVALTVMLSAAAAYANKPPVANAGPDRYVDAQPLTLDAGASYDPDPGDALESYSWTQVSGPAVTIANANTATPTITASPLANMIGTAVLQLIVGDGEATSAPDSIKLTIVAAVQNALTLRLENPPFDTAKPTAVFFTGGNCVTGAGAWGLGPDWEALVNVISFDYSPPYERAADVLIAFLSRYAPSYDRPIQTAGFSTGGMPAIDGAIRLNKIFKDPRYAISIVNLLDGACRNYDSNILDFISNPVGDKPAYVQNFYSSTAGKAVFRTRAINVVMEGDHGLPPNYYVASLYPIFSTDEYNHGLVAGAFTSVARYGANYRVPDLPSSPYFFHMIIDPGGATAHLEQYNAATFPGRLPQPTTLVGPDDAALVPPSGVSLGCTSSENAVAYDLLLGTRRDALMVRGTVSAASGASTGFLPPGQSLYWTIQARDTFGTTYRPDARSMLTDPGVKPDLNADGLVDAADCAIIEAAQGKGWGDSGFHLAADYNGDGVIECRDRTAWLADYRSYHGDPSLPPPCAVVDNDADGVLDDCDLCPDSVPGAAVDATGCSTGIPGDFNSDGDVDQSDFARMQLCFSPIPPAPLTTECKHGDLDNNSLVNQFDVDKFARCISGTDIAANPNCAN